MSNSLLREEITEAVARRGGWLPFDRFMQLSLYAPGLGYYTNDLRKFGQMPESGSDFVTAPEMTPLFGQTVAAQVAQALDITGTNEVWEFGAGSGALAQQLLQTLGDAVLRYTIIDLSGTLRERQQQRLQAWPHKVKWVSALPDAMQGVVLGNEVLDAMPVQLLVRLSGVWHERGVSVDVKGQFAWQDRPTTLRPPCEIEGEHDYLTEIHPQAESYIRTVVDRLMASPAGGACFFIDYGFTQAEYYHVQRSKGTVMCHQLHRADDNPLVDVGLKDVTAHVNFTGIALAAQSAGDEYVVQHPGGDKSVGVLGYCNQARFLMNSGLLKSLEGADLLQRSMALKLVTEHEMGELFKVIGLYVGQPWEALGFSQGDRTHTL